MHGKVLSHWLIAREYNYDSGERQKFYLNKIIFSFYLGYFFKIKADSTRCDSEVEDHNLQVYVNYLESSYEE